MSQISHWFNCSVIREAAFSAREGAISYSQSSANQPAFLKYSLYSVTSRKRKLVKFHFVKDHNQTKTLCLKITLSLIWLKEWRKGILKPKKFTMMEWFVQVSSVSSLLTLKFHDSLISRRGKRGNKKGKYNQLCWFSEQSMKPGQSMKTNTWFVFTFLSS